MSDPINKIFLMLGRIEQDIASMKEDVAETKAETKKWGEDYHKNKNRLLGICTGVSIFAGGSVSAILNKLGIQI